MNDFTENSATVCAGAFYSLLNTFTSTSPYSENTFTNNHAPEYDDVFETDSINLFIGNGNYTMYKVNQSNIDIIPSKYSLVDEGYVTIPKNQKVGGNCWAFATIAVLESCILKAGGPSLDLSEENMKNLMARFSDYGWNIDTNDGGNDQMLLGYLLSWLGPVFDNDDPYDDESTLSPIFNSTIHIQNVLYLYRDNYTDNDAIKEAILKYGAVSTAMDYEDYYFQGDGYYCWDVGQTNHQVCIVGWDDNYSASNFHNSPGYDGAWLVRNSWGPNWGNNGYFYVSYYDKSFAKPKEHGLSFTFILNDTIRFDRNYQYDFLGYTHPYINRNSEHVFFKNVFNATDDEYLGAVSTYFKKTTDWEVLVYVNGDLKSTLNGVSPAGYFTLNLEDMVRLNKGDTFEVVFHIIGSNSEFPMLSPNKLNNPFHRYGLSFMSYDGVYWYDLYDYFDISMNFLASIKAFTYKNEINTVVSLDVETSSSNIVNVTARVSDQFGNIIKKGNVTFNIEGTDYVVSINDGCAKVTHVFTTDISMITASFAKTGYVESHSSWQPVISVKLSDSIEITQSTATIYVFASKPINETVILSFNGRNYTKNLINGITSFTLTDLTNGSYSFEIFIQENPFINASSIDDSFEILTLLNTTITLNVNYEYVDNVNITAIVEDQYGNVVGTGQIIFNIEGTNYVVNITNATAQISHNFKCNYDIITATFTGAGYYNSSANYVLTIPKRQITLSDEINVTGKNVVIKIFANETINEDIIIKIGSSNYTEKLINGLCTLTLNDLGNGNYSVKVYLKDNIYYEAAYIDYSFEISISNTFIHVEDLQTYYKSGILYNITLVDDWGKPVAGKKITITFNKSNKYYRTTDENGVASIRLNLDVNTYEVDFEFEGDIYHKASKNSSKITVRSSIDVSNDVTYTYGSKYYATIYDKNGLSAKKKANIIVNGVTYSPISNAKGQISLNIFLKPGKHTVSVVNLETGEVKKQTIQVVARIGENKDLTKYYGASQPYKVRAFTDNGKPVKAGEIVHITISGKTYNVKTDKKGYASLPINLKPKTYTISAEYKGYKVSNKVIIKTTLISSNAQAKKGTTIKYFAKLLDSNGKVKVNVVVKFKFNGKIYAAKTSPYGYAIIYIANSLKAGKYNIVSTYGTLSNTNTIIIK